MASESILLKDYGHRSKSPLIGTIIGLVISGITLLVAAIDLVISCKAYDDRYNTTFSDAKSAQEIQFTYKSNGKTSGSDTVTMTAGTLYYGYFQKFGAKNTQYAISYKKFNSQNYTLVKTVRISNNNIYYGGDYMLTTSSGSMKYNIKVEKKNNISSNSEFVLDLAI